MKKLERGLAKSFSLYILRTTWPTPHEKKTMLCDLDLGATLTGMEES